MPDNFATSIISEIAAKVIAETCESIYEKLRNEAGVTPIADYVGKIDKVTRDCIEKSDFNENAAFTMQPLKDFLDGPDFRYIVTDMAATAVLGRGVASPTLALKQCQQAMKLYNVPSVLILQCSAALELLLNDILTRTHRIPEKDDQREERARRYLEERIEGQTAWRLGLLTTLVDRESVDLTRISDDIRRLRTAIAQVYSISSPTHMDTPTVTQIENIYVGPTLVRGAYTPSSYSGSSYSVPADLSELFGERPRVILIGDPGGGKTSLSNFIGYWLDSSSPAKNLAGAELAIPITLREHAVEVSRNSGLDILDAIQSTAKSHFQVMLTRAEVEYLCLTGRLLLILDGLDELLELRDRVSVRSSIDAFAALYPQCPIFATSRSIGYEQAALDPSVFTLMKILPFNERQIAEYARKWFMQSKGLTVLSREALLTSFLDESASLADLRSNPLLLSLMCSLYRHKRYIPKNRGQLYAKCAELLFDDWDRSRRLRQKFEFDGRIDGAIRHLAYWIFTDQEKQNGVPEPAMRAEVAKYLSDWIYGDAELGWYAAKTFLEFCKNRAWVLTEIGTDGHGDGLFQFAHRTFLEYFTAAYIVNKFSNEEVCEIILRRASDAAWHVVCQIAVQLASKKQQGLEDKILERLIPAIVQMVSDERRIATALCVRVVESVSLKPGTVKRIAEQAMEQFSAELTETPVGGVLSGMPVHGRDSLWLDSERVAVENMRAAEPVVRRILNESMIDSRAPQLELAHLLEFYLTSDCTPASVTASLNPENRSRLQDLVSGKGWEAWIEAAAVLMHLDGFNPRPYKGVTLGNFKQSGISSVSTPWGNRPLPNAIETLIWSMAHGDKSILDILEKYAIAGIGYLAESPPYAAYYPHLIWHNAQEVENALVDYAPRCLRLGVSCALALVEHSLAACNSEDQRIELISSYSSKPWGSLGIVPKMVEARYSLGREALSPAEVAKISSIGLLEWCENLESRAALIELVSLLIANLRTRLARSGHDGGCIWAQGWITARLAST